MRFFNIFERAVFLKFCYAETISRLQIVIILHNYLGYLITVTMSEKQFNLHARYHIET